MNWTKFDEISQEKNFLHTEAETGCKNYNDEAIDEAKDVWEDETVTLTNFELQEIVEKYENEVRKEKDKVINLLRAKIERLKEKLLDTVNIALKS